MKSIGSDQGCGCGFRYVTLQNGAWPEEWMIGQEGFADEGPQSNHRQLYEFLTGLLNRTDSIELYGCWEGDVSGPSEGHSVVSVSKILEETFFFRERFGYTVIHNERNGRADCATLRGWESIWEDSLPQIEELLSDYDCGKTVSDLLEDDKNTLNVTIFAPEEKEEFGLEHFK